MNSREIVVVAVISCILFVEYSSSQDPRCIPGWFGSDCQYKCRCTSDYCNNDGLCIRGTVCQGGWFGPACQYADLAYRTTPRLTDGDDSTCTTLKRDARTVRLHYRIPFSWMRVYVSRSDYLHSLTVTFRDGLGCTKQRNATVDDNTLDIYCDLHKDVWSVTLTGAGTRYLCSVYISGGRNIALKQKTNQTTTWDSYGSERAVDGDNNRDFRHGSCSVTVTEPQHNPWWSVTFSRPSHVNRYVLFTREGHEHRLQGFILESFDVNRTLVDHFKDTKNTTYPVYAVISLYRRSPISSVLIRNTNSENILELCEVEIYGETACEPGRYGRECEHTCNCAGGQPCFISTGGCPSGCATGFYGESCDLLCKPGSYGPRCKNTCSEFCAKNISDERSCDHVSGACLRGCESGYQTPRCTAREPDPDHTDVTATVLGSIPYVTGVVLVVLAVTVFKMRHRRPKSETERVHFEEQNDGHVSLHISNTHLYEELVDKPPTISSATQTEEPINFQCIGNSATQNVYDEAVGVQSTATSAQQTVYRNLVSSVNIAEHSIYDEAVVVQSTVTIEEHSIYDEAVVVQSTANIAEHSAYEEPVIVQSTGSIAQHSTYEEPVIVQSTGSIVQHSVYEEPVIVQSSGSIAQHSAYEEPVIVQSTGSIAQQIVYRNLLSTGNRPEYCVYEEPVNIYSTVSSIEPNVYDQPENIQSIGSVQN